jgi:hypothetical protein
MMCFAGSRTAQPSVIYSMTFRAGACGYRSGDTHYFLRRRRHPDMSEAGGYGLKVVRVPTVVLPCDDSGPSRSRTSHHRNPRHGNPAGPTLQFRPVRCADCRCGASGGLRHDLVGRYAAWPGNRRTASNCQPFSQLMQKGRECGGANFRTGKHPIHRTLPLCVRWRPHDLGPLSCPSAPGLGPLNA